MLVKKKRLNLIITIAFILIMATIFGIKFISYLQEIPNNIKTSLFIQVMLSIGLALLNMLLDYFYLIIIFVAIKFGTNRYYKEKFDETDFTKNKDIYRDIINNYNISTLNYIDKFKLEKIQSYTAKLLELQRKKIITIDGDSIRIINEPSEEIDKEFIKSIVNNKVTMPIERYEELCEKDALDNELLFLVDKKSRLFKATSAIAISFLLCFSAPFFGTPLLISSVMNNNIAMIIIFLIIQTTSTLALIFSIVYYYSYIYKYRKEPKLYNRTDKGKEINKKLDGLKNLIKEFGDVSNKPSEQLVLWDDYLIYSVMFNQNKKIINEYLKFIQ